MNIQVKFILVAVALPLMSSCTGLQLSYTDNRHHMTDETPKQRKSPQGIEQRTLSGCPVYVPPANRTTPAAPAAAFAAIKKDEHRLREALLLDYIEQLRNNIKDLKEDQLTQYKSYLSQCKETSE